MALTSNTTFEEVISSSAVAGRATVTMAEINFWAQAHATGQPFRMNNQALKYFRHIGEVRALRSCWLKGPDPAG